MRKISNLLWSWLKIFSAIVVLLLIVTSLASAKEIKFSEVKNEETTDLSASYWLEYDGCKFFVSKDTWVHDGQSTKSIALGVAKRCALPLFSQIEAFRHILKSINIGADLKDVKNVGLPKLNDIDELQRNVARAANGSPNWKIAVKAKRNGSSVNKETLALIREGAVYNDFVTLLAEFGIHAYLANVEKAFLARAGDLKQAGVPRRLLIPGTAIVSFKTSN